MAKKIPESNASSNPSDEAIARRAYEIWQNEGCPDGRAMEHWFRAVSELKRVEQPEQKAAAPIETPRLPRRATTPARATKRF